MPPCMTVYMHRCVSMYVVYSCLHSCVTCKCITSCIHMHTARNTFLHLFFFITIMSMVCISLLSSICMSASLTVLQQEHSFSYHSNTSHRPLALSSCKHWWPYQNHILILKYSTTLMPLKFTTHLWKVNHYNMIKRTLKHLLITWLASNYASARSYHKRKILIIY